MTCFKTCFETWNMLFWTSAATAAYIIESDSWDLGRILERIIDFLGVGREAKSETPITLSNNPFYYPINYPTYFPTKNPINNPLIYPSHYHPASGPPDSPAGGLLFQGNPENKHSHLTRTPIQWIGATSTRHLLAKMRNAITRSKCTQIANDTTDGAPSRTAVWKQPHAAHENV